MRRNQQMKILRDQESGGIRIEKKGLHPRNRHKDRYDFKQLTTVHPELAKFISKNKFGDESIDFANPEAVRALNSSILKQFYEVSQWDIPENYLCPPIPGRADYLHYVADLLSSCNGNVIPRGDAVRVLDIGVGASCIYPLIGQKEYGWHFVGSDTDPVALESAQKIINENSGLSEAVQLRMQTSTSTIFAGMIQSEEKYELSISNPPFHGSLEEAQEGSRRKWRNLGKENIGKKRGAPLANSAPLLNFGGQGSELWCPGGEEAFIRQMIEESALIPKKCFWFSTLVSKESSLDSIYHRLNRAKTFDVQTVDMAQGQKKSRIVAWTFLNKSEQNDWRTKRWQIHGVTPPKLPKLSVLS